jgi:hypothetical protein
MARAAALGKKGIGGLDELLRGKEMLQLGRPAGFEMKRVGGLLGEGGGAAQLGAGIGAAGQQLGAGADALEQFIAMHPNLAAGGAGLLGGGLGGAAYLAGHGQGEPDADDPEQMMRHKRGGMG